MKQAGLKCKPSKREILRESIKYLGLLVDKHGIKRDPEAVQAVLTRKARKIDTQLIEFIKGYADKIYPKQQLIQKSVRSSAGLTRLRSLLKALSANTLRGSGPRYAIRETDICAGNRRISSCDIGHTSARQEWNGRTVLRPIAYGSKVLSDTELKYGAPKAEMIAVIAFVLSECSI